MCTSKWTYQLLNGPERFLVESHNIHVLCPSVILGLQIHNILIRKGSGLSLNYQVIYMQLIGTN